MRLDKHDIPVKIDGPRCDRAPAAGLRSHRGALGAECSSLGAGTDITPLLVGLQDDACQSVHWGYTLSGALVVSYSDSTVERCTGGDVFYWPAGHSVRSRRTRR